MSFTDCIRQKQAEGSISKNQADQIIKEYNNLSKNSTPEKAFAGVRKNKRTNRDQFLKNLLLHQNKKKDFLSKMNKIKDPLERFKFIRKNFKLAVNQSGAEFNNILKVLNDGLDVGGLRKQDPENVRIAIKSIIDGKKAPNPQAEKLRSNIQNALKHAKNQSELSGLVMGDLGPNYMPRSYDITKVKNLTDDEFINGLMPLIDLRGKSPEQMIEILRTSKMEIQTNGRFSRLDDEASKIDSVLAGKARSEVQGKRNHSREIHFKDADSHFKAMELVGKGKDHFVQDLEKYFYAMSNDLGLAKIMGPTPRKMVKELTNQAEGYAEKLVQKGEYKRGAAHNKDLAFIEAEFNVVAGTSFTGNRENPIYKAFVSTQEWQRMSHLGSAAVSAIPDLNFNGMTSLLNGGSYMKPLKEYFNWFSGIGRKQQEELLQKMGYLSEIMSGNLMDEHRFSISGESDGVLRKGSDLLFKVSGLNAWTRGGKVVGQIEANNILSKMFDMKAGWEDLPKILRRNLETQGMDAAKWAQVSKDIKIHDGRQKFFNTDDLREMDPDLSNGMNDIADMLDRFVFSWQDLVVNENNITTRAVTSGAVSSGGQASTVNKMFHEALAQYKNFPITVINNHLLPAMKNSREGFGELAKGEFTKENAIMFSHLPMLVLGTGMMAIIPHQLKEALKGKTFKEFSPTLVAAGMAQGGGMGVAGDLIFNNTTQYGHSARDIALGPYFGTMFDAVDAVSRNTKDSALEGDGIDSGGLALDAFKFAKRNTPFANLWYSRLLVERFLFDSIERMIDPKFDKKVRRATKRMKKDGQQPWWKKGELAPDPSKFTE